MVISSFISSILVLAIGVWAYLKLESSMNIVAEKQLLIEPSKFSYKMWKDMPVTMYQSFTFFNLTNWNQVKSVGQKPRFVEVGPYVYRTIWTKSDINFIDEEKLVSFAEKKQWIFQQHLSKGLEDDQIWTINTPLMTALALIQNAPVITRNIVSVILDGLGEGAFIKRNIKSLLFEGYSDLIVSVGPLFDRRFSNFNGKFAYLYNKNDSVDGVWTVSTGTDDLATLNKITRFQSNIVNMTSFSSGQLPQGLNEVKTECAPAWSLDQSTNGQLFSPFNRDIEQIKLEQQLQQIKAKSITSQNDIPISRSVTETSLTPTSTSTSRRFFSRSANHDHINREHQQDLVTNPFLNQKAVEQMNQLRHHVAAGSGTVSTSTSLTGTQEKQHHNQASDKPQLRDIGKFIFYPDLCRPIHLLQGKREVSTSNGIQASRYYIDPRVFMNSTQVPSNRCYEMNPRPALANALAATINSVTGANVAMPNLVASASSPFAMFSPPGSHHGEQNGGLFERANHPSSFLNNALHSLSASSNNNQDQQTAATNNAPMSRLGRVRQLFSNIVSQRMSAAGPGSLLPSLAAGPAGMLIGNHFPSTARNSPDEAALLAHNNNNHNNNNIARQHASMLGLDVPLRLGGSHHHHHLDGAGLQQSSNPMPAQTAPPVGGSDRWITQFRFKWPKGVFSIGQCQLGAPIYASLPHFLDADEYYLEQVDGLRPNRSLHEFYIDVESTLHSIPVGAKARLQLNVATPELRFRNIPNAMIPVLWQEVTFEIDKPIASMLYWSFTMSATIYKLIAVSLLVTGSLLLVAAFVGGFKQHKRRINELGGRDIDGSTRAGNSNQASVQRIQQEGQRTSWRPQLAPRINQPRNIVCSNIKLHGTNQIASDGRNDNLDEIQHGAALNHAFNSCTELVHDNSNNELQNSINGPNNFIGNSIMNGGSPKQPSSRASSHCELVSSLGNTVNCAGCLLACLRHSPSINTNHAHDQATGNSDNSIVIQRQQVTASDIDKATLSSRESNLDSCSSIYTQNRSRTFK